MKKSKQKRRARKVVKKWRKKRQTITAAFLARDEVIIVPESTTDPDLIVLEPERRVWHMPEFISLVTVNDTGVKVLNGRKLRWVIPQIIHDNMVLRYKQAVERLHDPKVTRHEQLIFRSVKHELRDPVHEPRQGKWTTEDIYEPMVVRIKEGRKDEGKHFRWRKLVAHVYVSPSGKKYVQAKYNEKAALIIRHPHNDLRLRLFDGSLVAKRLRQQAKQIEHGMTKLEAKAKRGKAKRDARKAGKQVQAEVITVPAQKKQKKRIKIKR